MTSIQPDPQPDQIKDIPMLKKPQDEIQAMQAVQPVYKFLRPALKLFGVKTQTIDSVFEEMNDLSQKMARISAIPDEFNRHFSPLGWIMYEDMNVEVAGQAVDLANQGDFDAAEAFLVEHYTHDQLQHHLGRMNAIQAFRPRRELAFKALDDYEAERYHACVPAVLMIMDGLVNELTENQVGFFAKDADVTAWNSIAGHGSGLAQLAKLMGASRKRTNTDPVTIPYRNGILHGRDLNFGSKLVAAKAWAALFAIQEWAVKAEKDQLKPSDEPEPPKPTWTELFQQMSRTSNVNSSLDQWKAREVLQFAAGASINPDDYEAGSPEQALVEYLSAWKRNNFGAMSKVAYHYGVEDKAKPAVMRRQLSNLKLKDFQLLKVEDMAPVRTEVQAELTLEREGKTLKHPHTFNLIYEHTDKKTLILRGEEDGYWEIRSWEVYPAWYQAEEPSESEG